MVKTLVKKLVESWPENGLGLHGTQFKNVAGIRKEGLVKGVPYIATLPHPKYFKGKYAPSEMLSRAIGSALFAGSFALRKESYNPNAGSGDLPAIVIVRPPMGEVIRPGYDEQHNQFVTYGAKARKSYGKVPTSSPPESVAAHVRITRNEHRQIFKRTKGSQREQAMRSLLAMKTLKALRGIIEREAKQRAKGQQ